MALIDCVKPYIEVTQAVATVAALVVGAVWSRRTIFKKREEFPKIRLGHAIHTAVVDETHRFVRISLTIENQGSVLVRLDEVDSWLYQVAPWPDDILSEEKMLDVDRGDYRWPGVPGVSNRMIRPQKVEIEPEETQELHFDYLMTREVRTIIAYSYVNNPTKKIGIGWNTSTVHDMVDGGA